MTPYTPAEWAEAADLLLEMREETEHYEAYSAHARAIVCAMLREAENVATGKAEGKTDCTVHSIVLCPVCQRGDVWQEAVNRTQYVYKGESVKDGQEVIDYLLAEVASLLETQNTPPCAKEAGAGA